MGETLLHRKEEPGRNPEAVARLIREAETVAICCHLNPDGDTLGCATAMRLGLKQLGKKVSLFCDDKVPDELAFLPGAETIRKPGEAEGPFDLLLAVDVSDEGRLGGSEKLMKAAPHTAQIDHHGTNPLYMEVNSVDGKAPAACLLILEQLRALGVSLTEDIAVCLYTGISTDTGNFSYASTNAEVFEAMAELSRVGFPLAEVNRTLYLNRAKPQVRLIGRALDRILFEEDGQLACLWLTRQDFEDCGALAEHAQNLVNFGLDVEGVRMCLMARETPEGRIKMSLRAKEPDRVDDIAGLFGGGGHAQAAGISMDGPLDEAISKVRAAMIARLRNEV